MSRIAQQNPSTQEQIAQQNPSTQEQNVAKVLDVVQGAASLYEQHQMMVNGAKQINTTAPTVRIDSMGKPMFTLGQFTADTYSIKPRGASGNELLSGAVKGAAAGAAFGPWGAAIGGAVGGISAALSGGRRKTIQERRKSLAMTSLAAAQRMFNTSMEDYNSRMSAQSLYRDQQAQYDNRVGAVYNALS